MFHCTAWAQLCPETSCGHPALLESVCHTYLGSNIQSLWLSLNVLVRYSIRLRRLGYPIGCVRNGCRLQSECRPQKKTWHSDHHFVWSHKAVLGGYQLKASCTGTLKCSYFQHKLFPCQTFLSFSPTLGISKIQRL